MDEQLGADCWVQKVVSISCSNFTSQEIIVDRRQRNAQNRTNNWNHFDNNDNDEKEKNLGPSNRLFSLPTPQCFGSCLLKMTVLVGTLYFNPKKLNKSRLKNWPSGIVINRVFIDVKRTLCNYLPLKSVKCQTVCRIIFIEHIDHFASFAKHVH